MNLEKNLFGLISISFVGGILGRGFEYLVYIGIARTLGPAALGLFSFGLVVMSLSTTMSKVGLDKAARKFVPVYSDDKQMLAGVLVICLGGSFIIGTLASVSIYFGSGFITQYTSKAFTGAMLLFLIGIPLKTLMTVSRAATTGFLTTKYSVYIKDFGQSGSAITLVFLAAVFIGTIESVIIAYVASMAISAVLGVYFITRQGGFDGIWKPQLPVKKVFTYSLPLTLAAVAQYLITWTDILMLSVFESANIVGVYQAAYQTATILGFLMVAVGSIFPSVASNLYDSGEKEQLQTVFSALTKWVSYLSLLAFLFVIFYTDTILGIFGNEFSSGSSILLLIGGAFVLSSAVGPSSFLLMMTGHERVEMWNTSAACVMNIVLNFVLIQSYGSLGAAVATGVSLVTLNLLRLVEVRILLEIFPQFKNYWKGTVAIMTSGVIMYATTLVSVSKMVLFLPAGLVGLVVFILMMHQFGLDSEDKSLIESVGA
ncbi:flippase [Haloarcula onubensis]|uniref:Flippase n=1 Tax=Haloarcula onubensis TaxID=2950539 RepID=A0ABU2FJ55_9EURY|nr:flippase [Halomicroarcula sp. S3CR25-11]MDS0280785.1 flippase [Halomicroarcula sp. S3CR25-11]